MESLTHCLVTREIVGATSLTCDAYLMGGEGGETAVGVCLKPLAQHGVITLRMVELKPLGGCDWDEGTR